jgi:eukaryotic-like serine/threonine-protein kinase
MVYTPRPNDEPIPGYRLLERLGSGGFGEVWKAEAPGGLLKAIKIVEGDLGELEPVNALAHQELKGLERVKSMRHPYILSLERYDIIDGRLLIVMELADGTLYDHYQLCRKQGMGGVPREELLERLKEAAEALDLMNQRHQLQHLDIKPHNLFLQGGHVKVGDFGLVKTLEGMRAHLTGGLSALYSAPEMFENEVSSYCDQYSLAIVYQELLTGKHPFHGANPRQLMQQHLSAAPDLSSLPAPDRDLIARALAKKPEDRFPSCTDFLRALQGDSPSALLRKTLTDVAAERTTQPTGLLADKSGILAADGVLAPALVIGLGGVGGEVVRAFRQAVTTTHGTMLAHIRLLHIDVDAAALRGGEKEILHTPLARVSHYLKKKNGRPSINAWLPLHVLRRLSNDQPTTEGQRYLGRLALCDHYPIIRRRLAAELRACTNPIALVATHKRTGLKFRTQRPQVYLVTSLAGGCGSGMLLDVAYITRQLLREYGPETPEIVGVLFVPPIGPDQPVPVLQNARAALTELQHYADPRTTFTAWYSEVEEGIADASPPLQRCPLLSLGRSSPANGANLLYAELATGIGAEAARARASLPLPSPEEAASCQSAGTSRVIVPRRILLLHMTRKLCADLSQPRSRSLKSDLHLHAVEQWTEAGFEADALAGQLQAACERRLGSVPTALFQRVCEPLVSRGADSIVRDPAAALHALAQLERWLGKADGTGEAGMLEEVLNEVATPLAGVLQQSLLELQFGALGQLLFRAPGVENKFVAEIAVLCADRLRQQAALRDECRREEAQLRRRIVAAGARLQKGAWRVWNRAAVARELFDAVQQFPALRYRGLIVHRVTLLYEALQQNIAKLPAEFGCCRARLAPFVRQMQSSATLNSLDATPGALLMPDRCPSVAQAAMQALARLPVDEQAQLQHQAYALLGKQMRARGHLCSADPEVVKKLLAQIQQQFHSFAADHLAWPDAAEIYLQSSAVANDLADAFLAAAPAWFSATVDAEINVMQVPAGDAGARLANLARETLRVHGIHEAGHADEIVIYREASHVAMADLPHMRVPPGNETCHSRMDVVDWLADGSAGQITAVAALRQ